MKQGVLKSNRDDKMVPGFPAFELDGKWEHDSIGALLGAGMDCWSEGKLTSNGRLVIQFRNKRDGKICTFAVEPGFFEPKGA
jgi:hypothetical protein